MVRFTHLSMITCPSTNRAHHKVSSQIEHDMSTTTPSYHTCIIAEEEHSIKAREKNAWQWYVCKTCANRCWRQAMCCWSHWLLSNCLRLHSKLMTDCLMNRKKPPCLSRHLVNFLYDSLCSLNALVLFSGWQKRYPCLHRKHRLTNSSIGHWPDLR